MAIVKETDVAITRTVSHMRDSGMRKLLQDYAMKDLYLPNKAPVVLVPHDLEAFRDLVLQTIGNVRMTYLEFGVASGSSLRSMMGRFSHPGSRFFGFDSFEGLPENWHPDPKVNFTEGTFSRNGNLPVIDDDRAEFLRGWIQNTLPPFLGTGRVGGPEPHLVHYDADLYSATLFVLCTLWHHLPEYYFVMDEFVFDEVVALRDFAHSHPVEIKFLVQSGDKIFGRLRRVAFSL
jgi:O-methyltransferase